MKKLNKSILLLLFVTAVLGSCDKFGYLFKPVVKTAAVEINTSEAVWSWDKVPGASSYEVKIGADGSWIDVKTATEYNLPADSFTGDGEYTLYVRAKNENGDVSKESTLTISIDSEAPAVPAISDYEVKTNSAFPVWSWSKVDGADIIYYAFSAEGPWISLSGDAVSFRPAAPLSEGKYTFYLKAADSAGNESDVSLPVETVIDFSGFSAPELYAGTAGVDIVEDEVVVGKKVNISRPVWNWQMNLSAEELERLRAYRIQLDGQRADKWTLITEGVSSLGSFTPSEDLSEGLHSLYVQAGEIVSEGVYNWSVSGVFYYEIDQTAPQAPVVTGVESTMTIPEWNWSLKAESTQLKFGIIAGDFGINGDVISVSWVSDRDDEDGDGNTSEIIWNNDKLTYIPSANLPAGKWSVVVIASDESGNWSDPGYFCTEISVLSEDVPVVICENESPTSDATPVWTWSTSIEVAAYRYQLDAEDSADWIVVPYTTLEFTPTGAALESGLRTLYVQSLPEGLNPSTAADELWSDSGFAQVEVDLIPPASPSIVGAEVTGSRRPAWTWNVPDDTVSEFRFKLAHAEPLSGGQFEIADGSWTMSSTDVTSYIPGSDLIVSTTEQEQNFYALEVQAADRVGNWSESAIFVTQIRTDVPPSPVVTGLSLVADSTPTWTWSADNPNGYSYQLDSQSGAWTETTEETFTASAPLSDGPHTLYVKVKNELDLWSGAGFFMITVDTTGPSAPEVGGPAISGQRRPTWVWGIPTGAEGFRYQLNGEDSGSWNEVAVDITSFTPDYNLVEEPAEEGSATLYVQAKDSLGNWGDSGSYEISINTAGGSAPVVTGDTPTVNEYPTWSWDEIPGAVKYRISLDNAAGPWTEITGSSYSSPLPLDGKHTLYVQCITSSSPVWSESGSFEIDVDRTAPAVPVVTSKGPKTGDLTPTWWWAPVADTVKYRYKLGLGGDWTEITSDLTSFTPSSDLAEDVYTLYVQAGDEIGNWSESGFKTVTVDSSFKNLGIPGKVYLDNITKGHFGNAVRIEWIDISDADSYKIYKITQAELDSGDEVGTALSFDILYHGVEVNGNHYYYDINVSSGNYYYRVSAVNEDGEGQKSDFSTVSEKIFAKGFIIDSLSTENIYGAVSRTKWHLEWENIEGVQKYSINRSNTDSDDLSDYLSVEVVESPSYDDTTSGNDPAVDTNYYKVLALNSDVVADDLTLKGEYSNYSDELSSAPLTDINAGYSVSSKYALKKSVLPVVSFTPSENNSSYINKINVSGSVSGMSDLDRVNIILVRSCQYGDDPDVHPLAEPTIDYGSAWTPLATEITTFTKEINLSGYINESGVLDYTDPMPVYEYNSETGIIEEIAGEQMLWNYKRWDREAWKDIKRKHSFNMDRAVKVSYKIVIERKIDPEWDPSISAVKKGYPALGAEEFAHLAMFLKDCAFNRIWHMQVPRYNWGTSSDWLSATQDYPGENNNNDNSGHAYYAKSGAAGGVGGFDNYSDWPGFSVSNRNLTNGWAGISVTPNIFASNSEEHISFWLAISTPIYNGHVYINNLAVRDYIYQWGVYNTASNKGTIDVYYNNYNNHKVPALNILFEYSPSSWNTVYSTQKAGYKDYDKHGFHTGHPDQVSTPLTKINFRYHPDPWGKYGNWNQYGTGWNLKYGLTEYTVD